MANRIEIELTDDQAARLGPIAERLGGTLGEAGAVLIEEALREAEFPWIDFRDTILGRQAFAQGSGMAVWEVIMVARDVGMDAQKVAELLSVPLPMVQGCLRYTEAYPDEIYGALAENDACDFESLKKAIPTAEEFVARGKVSEEDHRAHAAIAAR
jgi:uncharacterized protein (DUF433 family)